MRTARRSCWRSLSATLVAAGLIGQQHAAAQVPAPSQPFILPEHGSNHIAVVILTTKDGLGICEDVDRVEGVFRGARDWFEPWGAPIAIEDPIVLKGPSSRADLFRTLQAAVVEERTTLFCYCKLHGETDAQGRSQLLLDRNASGPPAEYTVSRDDLQLELQNRGARLTVLITDSCSYAPTAPAQPGRVYTVAAKQFPGQLFIDLLLAPEGFVSVNSSSGPSAESPAGQFAWMDLDGGLFTRTFSGMFAPQNQNRIAALHERIDSNKNGRFSWSEFFPVLAQDTDALYQQFRQTVEKEGFTPAGLRAAGISRTQIASQSHQHPRTFFELPTAP